MFRGGQVNPYDDIVVKATDENQTSENWEILLNLCDKVSEEGEQGARNVIAALLKRLTHRNANVQLYALSVAEALSKNCDITVHREVASKAFTQGLEKLATDRNGHDKVKKRTLALIKMWAGEFAYDPQLGLMEECYSSLKSKGMRFDDVEEAPAPTYDDEARRREEEELQRVLEMSLHDKGGRDRWADYTNAGASGSGSGAGPAAGSSSGPAYTPAAYPAVAASSSRKDTVPAPAPAPVPVQAPAPAPAPAPVSAPAPATPVAAPSYSAPAPASQSPSAEAAPLDPGTMQIVKRVKALHDFNATEQGELSFKKGDVIKIVDRCYKDWWRGQIKGTVGLLPVNYVEPLPEPTATELAKEAEAEALVWSQGGAIDTLLQKLREFDPATDNLNDSEEIQELYRSAMSLRPKILKLIDKYSQKKAELVVMNERYVKARNTFERMMEESVAKHNPSAAIYEYGPQAQPEGYARPPIDNRGVSTYGWNQSVYGQIPDPAAYAAYQAQVQAPQQQPQPQPQPQPQQAPVQNVPQEYPPQPYGPPQPQSTPYPQEQQYAQQQPQQQWYQGQQGQQQYGPQHAPNAPQAQAPLSPGQQPQPQPQPQPQSHPQQQQGYQPGQPGYPYGGEQHAQQAQLQPQPQPQPQPQTQGYPYGEQQQQQPQAGQPGYQYAPEQQQQQQQQQPGPEGQPGYHPTYQQGYQQQSQQPQQSQPQPQSQSQSQQQAQQQQQQAYQLQPAEPVAAEQGQSPQTQHAQPDQAQVAHEAQPQPQPQPQPQSQEQPQPQQTQQQQQQPQQQQPQQQQAQAQAGPPYTWNGTAVYPNPGACQWAEYYLGGGEDPSGLVYFMGPDGNVLTSIPRGSVDALQQGMAGVSLT